MDDLPTIYLDLDGTILDVEERYYNLHVDLARDLGHRPLERETFWALKRRPSPLDVLLKDWDGPARKEYAVRWEAKIESPDYLRFDRPIPCARAALEALGQRSRLELVTMRRDATALHQQLAGLGIRSLFDNVIAAGDHPAPLPKADMVVASRNGSSHVALVVGDSEADVEVARRLGTPSVCVLTGIRDRAFLEGLSPTYILDCICELLRLDDAILARDSSVALK